MTKDDGWETAITLQDLIIKMLDEGRTEEVISMLKQLPEETRGKYRETWVQWKQERLAKTV